MKDSTSNSHEFQALVCDLTKFLSVGVRVGFTAHTHSVGEGHPIYSYKLLLLSLFIFCLFVCLFWGGGGFGGWGGSSLKFV